MAKNRDIERRKPDEIERLAQRSLEYLKEFEEQGLANVEEPDLEGWDLGLAAEENRVDMARALIGRGDDVDGDPYSSYYGPLHDAARGDFLDMARLLIDSGADTDRTDDGGGTPLHWAAEYNSPKVARLLIDNKADIEARDDAGATPLHDAAEQNSTGVARMLIEHDAEVNAKDNYGATPLHAAADVDVARLLIVHGADIKAKNNYGATPLQWAVWVQNSTGVVHLLIEHGANADDMDLGAWTIHHAAKENRVDIVRALIERGDDLDARDKEGRTALHWAALKNSLHVVNELFDPGSLEALNEPMDKLGRTPLHLAALGNSFEVANEIILAADIEAEDNDGHTALYFAAKNQSRKIVRLLLGRGANTDGIDLIWTDDERRPKQLKMMDDQEDGS